MLFHVFENVKVKPLLLLLMTMMMMMTLMLLQCAEDESIRELIRQFGGLVPLVNVVNNPEVNPEVLLAATGAIWKLSKSQANAAAFQKLGVIPLLVRLLTEQPEKVRVYRDLLFISNAIYCGRISKIPRLITAKLRRIVGNGSSGKNYDPKLGPFLQ